jgi:hypothetical protein
MNDTDKKIERLLRSAAQTSDDVATAAPFGFETRVVALWRSAPDQPNGLTALLRRVALLSTAVLVISTVAAVREVRQNREIGDLITNEFAIADTAIQTEFTK